MSYIVCPNCRNSFTLDEFRQHQCAPLVPRVTVAERFCTLTRAIGIKCEAVAERLVRITCELPDDVATAQRGAFTSAKILRVTPVINYPSPLILEVHL